MAYLSLYCRTIERGSDSLNLWGPVDGLVAHFPPSFPSIQDLGAAILFICFLGPLAYLLFKEVPCQIFLFKDL